ncbi:MAG: ImmA/IrrE family metallo-endopeptidase [Acidobacteria bacterium]|nr:ImmA/IrrE family metallo-endopeptidase [Acidobacteriota bacterium]
MAHVEVAPEILRWAIERSGKSVDSLHRRFPKLAAWLDRKSTPTQRQLESFAAATYTPFGLLFLPEPPVEPLPIPDFRTRRAETLTKPSGDLLDTIYLCQQRQAWFEDFAREESLEPVRLVNSVTRTTPVPQAAAAIRAAIGLDLDQRRQLPSWTDALRHLIHAVEDAGVLIMVNGVVGSNTHRKLNPEEFRGFALAHPTAPLIFVNGADSKSAQMFTVAHELAHLALGESALSDAEASVFPETDTEHWCNQVAAEVLVPLSLLQRELRHGESVPAASARLARRFKVSSLVILRSMFEAGVFSSRERFWTAYHAENRRLRDLAPAPAAGGDFYRTLDVRVSRRFEYALVASTLGGRTTFGEALNLLGFKRMLTFDNLAQRLGFTG